MKKCNVLFMLVGSLGLISGCNFEVKPPKTDTPADGQRTAGYKNESLEQFLSSKNPNPNYDEAAEFLKLYPDVLQAANPTKDLKDIKALIEELITIAKANDKDKFDASLKLLINQVGELTKDFSTTQAEQLKKSTEDAVKDAKAHTSKPNDDANKGKDNKDAPKDDKEGEDQNNAKKDTDDKGNSSEDGEEKNLENSNDDIKVLPPEDEDDGEGPEGRNIGDKDEVIVLPTNDDGDDDSQGQDDKSEEDNINKDTLKDPDDLNVSFINNNDFGSFNNVQYVSIEPSDTNLEQLKDYDLINNLEKMQKIKAFFSISTDENTFGNTLSMALGDSSLNDKRARVTSSLTGIRIAIQNVIDKTDKADEEFVNKIEELITKIVEEFDEVTNEEKTKFSELMQQKISAIALNQ